MYRIYTGHSKNYSFTALFAGSTIGNISMAEIYSINYNKSIYHLGLMPNTNTDPSILEVKTSGYGGAKATPMSQPLLSSDSEICFSFDLSRKMGDMNYQFTVKMFVSQMSVAPPALVGFMSLPHQTRGFDRFQLFKVKLVENTLTTVAQSVYSLKVLERRNTMAEPCVAVDNYDQVG